MKNKNIFLLSTDEDSNQFIYITSNEDVELEDWFINTHSNTILKAYKVRKKFIRSLTIVDEDISKHWCKKIVLTNDPTLIADGVQETDSSFLSFFAENPVDYVEVKREEDGQYIDHHTDESVTEGVYENYSLIFPQIKERAKNYMRLKSGYKEANFAEKRIETEEKLYTKQDLEKAFNQGCAYTIGSHELFKQTHLNFKEWYDKNYGKRNLERRR